MNLLATAATLSDHDLLARVIALAQRERESSVELVAHLGELDSRTILAAKGYSSTFAYCTEVLRLSEDATYTRIRVARAARKFPVILERLTDGSLTLTSVRLLAAYLTAENHEAVLAEARHRSKPEIEVLVARLAPRPDAPTFVRKLPAPQAVPAAPAPAPAMTLPVCEAGPEIGSFQTAMAAAPPPIRRPVIAPTAPERYRVQFTIGQEAHDMLREVQRLLRREIPDGDPGAIFERALPLLRKDVARKKLGETSRPRRAPTGSGTSSTLPATTVDGRYIPAEVRRFVWRRDGGQCAFVAADGRRCCEREFLEWHHVDPYGKGGPPTVENISLCCRRHNVYESELIFGPYGASNVRKGRVPSDRDRSREQTSTWVAGVSYLPVATSDKSIAAPSCGRWRGEAGAPTRSAA